MSVDFKVGQDPTNGVAFEYSYEDLKVIRLEDSPPAQRFRTAEHTVAHGEPTNLPLPSSCRLVIFLATEL